jgi:putative Mg2+ transporter-C (MgtC) family protein
LAKRNFYDDSRVAAGVVQGIGFLGAGLIIVRGVSVVGATTAVTVWALAGIGLPCPQAWLAAVLTTITIIGALELALCRMGCQPRPRARKRSLREADEDVSNREAAQVERRE